MNYIFQIILYITLFGLSVSGCSTYNSNDEGAGFSVKLVDAPGDYEKVLVDVQAIEIVLDGKKHRLPVIEPGVYDLLELTGGVSAKLVETVLPAGRLSQIKLVLGEANKIVNSNGDHIELLVKNGQKNGLKVDVHQDMQSNLLYDFILDFNVEKSIVPAENGEDLILNPVIRSTLEAQSGGIAGVVKPGGMQSLVSAITRDSIEIASYTAEDTGVFYLYGVPEGTYTINITPNSNSKLPPVAIKEVRVESGRILDLGVIGLE